MTEQFKRQVTFTPAFDKRSKNPRRNYGIHGVEMRFHLIGDHGATQFVIYTNWQLPEVTKELDARPVDRQYPHLACHPLPADVGYHRATPRYEGQTQSDSPCEFLGGQRCYYDGSGLMAQELFEKFTREGEEAVWRELEEVYRRSVIGNDDE